MAKEKTPPHKVVMTEGKREKKANEKLSEAFSQSMTFSQHKTFRMH